MEPRLQALLEQLHRHGAEHDAHQPQRLARLRNLEPDSAALLGVLVRASGARAVLELGTSNGYSTLWLADAVRSTGGRVVSVEVDDERSRQAAENLRDAGLDAVAELRVTDAGEALAASGDGEWELIFLDAERPAYAGYWPALVRALAPGGLLVVDNVLSHAQELVEFRALVRADARVAAEAVVPTGAGLLLAVTRRGLR